MGIEPTLSAWEADVLPLNYTRKSCRSSYVVPAEPWSLSSAITASPSDPSTHFPVRVAHREICPLDKFLLPIRPLNYTRKAIRSLKHTRTLFRIMQANRLPDHTVAQTRADCIRLPNSVNLTMGNSYCIKYIIF